MARKSGFVRRNGAMRRETEWIGGSGVFTTMGSAQAVLVTSLSAAALALRPFTIVRTRGWLLVRSDQQGAVENFDAAYGIAVVSDQAAAVGVTAVPTPTTDDSSDLWLYYQRVMGTLIVTAGSNVVIQVDSKAMRKVNGDQDIVDVIENPIATGCVVGTYSRTLVKLH